MTDRPALRRRRRLVAAVAALAVALVVGLVVLRVTGPAGSAADFVTRSGATLRVGGSAYRFVGFNLYDAAASDIYSCQPATRLDDAQLDDAMASVKDSGGTVVRFWAYQTYTEGGTDYDGVDRVIAAARSHGLRVLPVLEDGPGNCSTGTHGQPLSGVDYGTWYAEGYRQPLGTATLSYRAYAARISAHYRDNPTILAWSLMNEAETSRRDADGQSELVDFARDMAGVVHAADPHHLVTLGTQSNGAPGASGSDFTAVYRLPGLDLTEVHDWGDHGSDTEALPGSPSSGRLPSPDQCQATDAQVACSFALARQLGKPVIVGEAGIAADDASGQTTRARELGAKLAAAFRAGASGYLVWQLNRANTDGYAVLVGTDDPLYATLRTAAARWSAGS